eukprot:TRINITY_DN49076_c0_g1_i1.p1 TRINITY_DN49076_c0_g1~~TRINITY_DN49076_c0_g1_i1.p1  ORF type:complete len:539 (-),score=117.73 TRINITY_DN49076_c0_g1_i1:165-1781(-)
MADDDYYSEDFESSRSPSGQIGRSRRSDELHSAPNSARRRQLSATAEEEHYSDSFEDEQESTAVDHGPTGVLRDLSQLPGVGPTQVGLPRHEATPSRSAGSPRSSRGSSKSQKYTPPGSESAKSSAASSSAASRPQPKVMGIADLLRMQQEPTPTGSPQQAASTGSQRSSAARRSREENDEASREASEASARHKSRESTPPNPAGRVMDISQLMDVAHLQQAAKADTPASSQPSQHTDRASGSRGQLSGQPSGQRSQSSLGGDSARAVPCMDISQLAAIAEPAAEEALAGRGPAFSDDGRRPPSASPATSSRAGAQMLEPQVSEDVLRRSTPGLVQLPSSQWRAPDDLDAPGARLPPATMPRPAHDAVRRHLKPHVWDIAALGQEEPRQAWADSQEASGLHHAALAQPPLGGAHTVVHGGAAGFGATKPPLPAGTEAALVDRLAQRFVLDRKAPTLQQRERAAYREMLQQVSWTALEPTAAHEASLLLGKRWLAPVSSTETLRAFRRCLHSILTDERVVDIVEHQMALHFSRTVGAGN